MSGAVVISFVHLIVGIGVDYVQVLEGYVFYYALLDGVILLEVIPIPVDVYNVINS